MIRCLIPLSDGLLTSACLRRVDGVSEPDPEAPGDAPASRFSCLPGGRRRRWRPSERCPTSPRRATWPPGSASCRSRTARAANCARASQGWLAGQSIRAAQALAPPDRRGAVHLFRGPASGYPAPRSGIRAGPARGRGPAIIWCARRVTAASGPRAARPCWPSAAAASWPAGSARGAAAPRRRSWPLAC